MKIFAYLRVSKDTQDTNNQKLAVLEFARSQKLKISHFLEVSFSSRKSTKERKIDDLLQQLNDGDTLIVSELSRMGRSVGEIISTIDCLVKKQVKFFAIKEGIKLNGSIKDIQSKVMITLFSLFAEIERDLISLRTREALAAAKACGKQLGRPKGSLGKSKLDGKEQQIKGFLALKISKSSIAKLTGVDRSTLHHFILSRNLS
ncbi:MAG: resolvase-like protein [Stygiobacter sp.]|nr:MAG: resolvase-like protein [Stygiobacter sp.]